MNDMENWARWAGVGGPTKAPKTQEATVIALEEWKSRFIKKRLMLEKVLTTEQTLL
jgi:hypothetical protein